MRIPRLLRAPVIWLLALLPLGVPAAPPPASTAAEAITVLWTERRPFQYTDENGQTKGILVDLGMGIFTQAGLEFNWAEVPANRVLMELKVNDRPLCAVGWYKTPEREAIAQFSLPVYRDKPLRGVFRSSVYIKPGTTAREVFEDHRMRLLIKQGFAYGSLDALIARKDAGEVQRVVGDARNLLDMLRANRADLALLAQEEIDYYARVYPQFDRNFQTVAFQELQQQPEQRYIMCSKRVTADTMKRINAAIAATVKLK